jgi:alkylation response protein AidB-like acyl-CoA dehydrogenase
MELCRTGRLTRNQHVLLRLGELVAWVEGSAALARRAARHADGALPEKADRRFSPDGLAAVARVFARDAAAKVALDGVALVVGADPAVDPAAVSAAARVPQITAAMRGRLADQDLVADAVYHRA